MAQQTVSQDLTVGQLLLHAIDGFRPLATSFEAAASRGEAEESTTYVFDLGPGFNGYLLRFPNVEREPLSEIKRRLSTTTSLYPVEPFHFDFGQALFTNRASIDDSLFDGFQIISRVPGKSLKAMADDIVAQGKTESQAHKEILTFLDSLPVKCWETFMKDVYDMTREGLAFDMNWSNIFFDETEHRLRIIDPVFAHVTPGDARIINSEFMAAERRDGIDGRRRYIASQWPALEVLDTNNVGYLKSITLNPYETTPEAGPEVIAQNIHAKMLAAALTAGVPVQTILATVKDPPNTILQTGTLHPDIAAALEAIPADMKISVYRAASKGSSIGQESIKTTANASELLQRLDAAKGGLSR